MAKTNVSLLRDLAGHERDLYAESFFADDSFDHIFARLDAFGSRFIDAAGLVPAQGNLTPIRQRGPTRPDTSDFIPTDVDSLSTPPLSDTEVPLQDIGPARQHSAATSSNSSGFVASILDLLSDPQISDAGVPLQPAEPIPQSGIHLDGITRDLSNSTDPQEIDLTAKTPDNELGAVRVSNAFGNQNAVGGSGNDTLTGDAQNNTLIGNGGDDHLIGNDGNDHLVGGAGNDRLVGGNGDDVVEGGLGDDVITGGAGKDFLTGGDGADTFHFDPSWGVDTITDFQQGTEIEDVMAFSRGVFADFAAVQARMHQIGDDVLIRYDANNSVLIKDATISQFHANDFSFF